jgi:hypothetical protein
LLVLVKDGQLLLQAPDCRVDLPCDLYLRRVFLEGCAHLIQAFGKVADLAIAFGHNCFELRYLVAGAAKLQLQPADAVTTGGFLFEKIPCHQPSTRM